MDRRGAASQGSMLFTVLWEEKEYDHSMQKQMDVVIRSLRDTLKEYGIEALFELKNRNLRIVPELIECDFYRFLEGEEKSAVPFLGEYMSQYSWASETEAQLSKIMSIRTRQKR